MSSDARQPVRVLETACPLDCPDNCSLEVSVQGGEVKKIDAGSRNPGTAGYICGKVRAFDRHASHRTRLDVPLLRKGAKGAGEFEPISWDDALARIVAEIQEVTQRFGGEAILPLYYGGSNGVLTQGSVDERFFRRLGASRLLTTVCAVPTGLAAGGMYGRMPGLSYADYEHAKLIVVWGANPSASGIHLVPHIRRAQEKGALLVVVDPRRTKLAKAADLHLALRPGTDLPLALALLGWLFEHGADTTFLREHASQVEELRARTARWSLERAATECDLDPADLERFARLYRDTSPAVVRCGWGLERNRHGGSAVCAVLALPAVAGKFGVRGGGYTLSNNAAMSLDAPVNEPERATREINMNRVGRYLLEELDPPLRFVFVYNHNPLATLPDQERVRRGLAREEIFTVVHDQVMTDTARYADLVLPATTFLEHTELSRGYGNYSMQLAEPVVRPFGQSRANYELFGELIERLGLGREGDPVLPEQIVQGALADQPSLLSTLRRDRAAFPAWGAGVGPVQFVDVVPRTEDARIHLVPAELDRMAPGGLYSYRGRVEERGYPLTLISPATEKTISSTFGQLNENCVPLEIHPDDARERGLANGDAIRVHNELGEVRTVAKLSSDLRPGTVCMPKGIWSHNTHNGRTSNALCPDSLADLGGGACFNDARVEVEPAQEP